MTGIDFLRNHQFWCGIVSGLGTTLIALHGTIEGKPGGVQPLSRKLPVRLSIISFSALFSP
jgi:hypothetical protein